MSLDDFLSLFRRLRKQRSGKTGKGFDNNADHKQLKAQLEKARSEAKMTREQGEAKGWTWTGPGGIQRPMVGGPGSCYKPPGQNKLLPINEPPSNLGKRKKYELQPIDPKIPTMGMGNKKPNAWIDHVKAHHANNPHLSYKEAMQQARETYKK